MVDEKWREGTGVSNDTARITVICKTEDKEGWTRRAEKEGYSSRSQYLYELIREAEAYRSEGFLGPLALKQRIEEQAEQIELLQERLEREKQKRATTREVDDPEFVRSFLDDSHASVDVVLQRIVESGALDALVMQRVEATLNFLAAVKEDVEFHPQLGWRIQENHAETSDESNAVTG